MELQPCTVEARLRLGRAGDPKANEFAATRAVDSKTGSERWRFDRKDALAAGSSRD